MIYNSTSNNNNNNKDMIIGVCVYAPLDKDPIQIQLFQIHRDACRAEQPVYIFLRQKVEKIDRKRDSEKIIGQLLMIHGKSHTNSMLYTSDNLAQWYRYEYKTKQEQQRQFFSLLQSL